MSDNRQQGDDLRQTGAEDLSQLPPYERIMRQQAAARAAQEAPETQPPQEKPAQQWETRKMEPVRPAAASTEERPKTLAEAAAKRAATRSQQEEAQKQAPRRQAQKQRPQQGKASAAAPKSQTQRPSGRPKRRRKRVPWVAIVLLVCVAIVSIAGVQFARNWILPANADDTSIVEVEIPSGATVSSMGDILEEQGLIRSSTAFNLYVRMKDVAAGLQAGVHDLSPSMTMAEIVANLQEGAEAAGISKVTVNEGLTVDQIADVVADSTRYSAEDFMELMSDDAFLSQLVSAYPILSEAYNNPDVRYALEGYLFPATYDFDEDAGLENLVTQMVDKTNEVLAEYQSAIDASSYSLNEIMSVASLVEKEGMTSEDRRLIAGVFYNRLDLGMAIQSDISVLYALGTHKEMVTYDDLAVESPYNLYTNTGLPPGPLNSPSEDAIAAALNPTDSDYIYFYANLQTGEVFYTDDYDQHLAWQQEYEETGDIQG